MNFANDNILITSEGGKPVSDTVGAGAGKIPARLSKQEREAFLASLAETSNVTASAKAAGITTSRVYRERRKFPSFRAAWHEALCEGYARLETMLLGEALIAANGNISATTLKSRALKYRLGMGLFVAHSAAVREIQRPTAKPKDSSTAKQRMEAKFAEMHQRMKDAQKR